METSSRPDFALEKRSPALPLGNVGERKMDMEERVGRIETQLSKHDERLDRQDERMDRHSKRIHTLEDGAMRDAARFRRPSESPTPLQSIHTSRL